MAFLKQLSKGKSCKKAVAPEVATVASQALLNLLGTASWKKTIYIYMEQLMKSPMDKFTNPDFVDIFFVASLLTFDKVD